MEKFSLDALAEQTLSGSFEEEDLACYYALWLAIVALSKYPKATDKLLSVFTQFEANIDRKAIAAAKAGKD